MYNTLIYTNNKVIIDTVQGLSKNNVKETLHKEIDWITRILKIQGIQIQPIIEPQIQIQILLSSNYFVLIFLKQTSIFKLGHKHYLNVLLTDNG